MDWILIIHLHSCLPHSDLALLDFGWKVIIPRIPIAIPSSRSGLSIWQLLKCRLARLSSLFLMVLERPPKGVTILQLVCPTYWVSHDLYIIPWITGGIP